MLTLPEIASNRARESPDSTACLFLRDSEAEGTRLSFAELEAAVSSRAAWLQRHTRVSERVTLAYPAGTEFIVSFLACMRARLIPVPVALPGRRDQGARRLQAVIASCTPRLLLSTATAAPQLPVGAGEWRFPEQETCVDEFEECGAAGPEDVAFLQYTSGSTQNPRGVAVTHRALQRQLEYHRMRGREASPETIFAGWLPHYHDFGLVGFHLSALFMGAPHIFLSPAAFLQRPLRWLEAISRYRATYSGGPNFAYELCVNAADTQIANLDLSCWKIASIAGEPIAAGTLRRFAQKFAACGFRQEAFLPAYGLAEGVLCVAARKGLESRRFDRRALAERRVETAPAGDAVELVACGEALAEGELCIVDPETCEPLADGRVGEIWVAGDGVAQGYWESPQLTASTFQAQIAGASGAFLRTGDYGFLYEGDLYVSGRMKDALIVRGSNHAPEDIEATIESVGAGFRSGCGAVFQTRDGEPTQIVAVYELGRTAVSEDHREWCKNAAEAVARTHGVRLNSIVFIKPRSLPRTSSGKVRRHECKERFLASKLEVVFRWEAHVADDIEARLIELLGPLLPGARITASDNLFSMGCDSLAMARFLAGIEETFGMALPPQVLYDAPTVAALAERIRGKSAANTGSYEERLCRIERTTTEIHRELRLLREALERRAERPGAARALGSPALCELAPLQREIRMLAEMSPALAPALIRSVVLELRGESPREDAVREILREIASRHGALRTAIEPSRQIVLPFVEPEVRTATIRASHQATAWLLEEKLRPFQLDRAPLWRAALLRSEDGATLVAILAHASIADGWSMNVIGSEFARLWTGAAPGASESSDAPTTSGAVTFALDLPSDGEASYEAGLFVSECRGSLRTAVQEQGGRNSATLFQTLLAAFAAMLHRYTGEDRVTIGVESGGREGVDAVGCGAGPMPLTIDLAGDRPNVELAVRAALLQGMDGAKHDARRPVRLGATIGFCAPASSAVCVPRFDLAAAAVSHHLFPLTLDVRDLGTSLRFEWTYRTSMLSGERVERMAESYGRLLEAIGAGGANLLDAEILSDCERRRLLELGAPTAAPLDPRTFRGRFEAQVACAPEAIAVIDATGTTTYRELHARAARLVSRFAAFDSGGTVAILALRGAQFIAAMIATIGGGSTYLPLDPSDPPLSIRLSIKAAAPRVIWVAAEFRELAETVASGLDSCRLLSIEDEPAGGGEAWRSDEAASMLAQLDAKIAALKLRTGDVVAQSARAGSSDSIWQMLAPLVAGAVTRVFDIEPTSVDLAANGVTVWQASAPAVREVLEVLRADGAAAKSMVKLRWLVSDGLPADLCRRWFGYFPRTCILSCFGRAEFGGSVTQHILEWPPSPEEMHVPIGGPIAGFNVSIRDRRGALAPLGTPGELCVERMGRLHRTGERARWRDDGALEHLGDLAGTTVNGWPIDLSAVETTLRTSPAVYDAAAIVKGSALVAYAVLRPSPATSAGILRAIVRNALPAAFVPSQVIFVDRLPRTALGAVDREALPAPESPDRPSTPTPPGTSVEEAICAIWMDALERRPIGIHDDFFELGGTSLAASRIATRIGHRFRFQMPVSEVFRASTVAGAAAYVEKYLSTMQAGPDATEARA